MSDVRTRDEALASVDRGLSRWLITATGVFHQASATVTGAKSEADGAVRKWANRVAAVEAKLSALGEGGDPRPLQQELARARQAHQAAQGAATQIENLSRRVAVLQRSHAQRVTSLTSEARADLGRRTGELSSYRGSSAETAGGAGSTGSARSGNSGSALASLGLGLVDVDSADFADNPILDNFGKGGTSRADYRWAVQTWDEVVGPGVARGMTRQDFERRDAERGAASLRRTAAVYDMFLGDSDRIRVSRLPGGGLDVTNGRHRLQIASELGIRNLPGEIT